MKTSFILASRDEQDLDHDQKGSNEVQEDSDQDVWKFRRQTVKVVNKLNFSEEEDEEEEEVEEEVEEEEEGENEGSQNGKCIQLMSGHQWMLTGEEGEVEQHTAAKQQKRKRRKAKKQLDADTAAALKHQEVML